MESRSEPVAIVGLGCRWPGGVRDSTALWDMLKNRGSGYRDFGDHRFPREGFVHPNAERMGSVSTRGAFLLSEDARLFDHAFYGIQPPEAKTLDPGQRKLLEVAFEAFENAGETLDSVAGSRTGVFVGNFAIDHTIIQARDPDFPRPYNTTGTSLSLLSNRISYIFDLKGPSITIDTACSSSMHALHLAVKAIRAGECDSAVVAASNWITDPTVQIMMNKLGALSSTSRCHTFDAAADGYARGEGFAALYLRKTSTALQFKNPIRGFVRGVAINSNGRTAGITHPSKLGQEAVIRQAYQDAGDLTMADTAYFECHGTGTPVGDPIEIEAIGKAYSAFKTAQQPLYVGSVKTNLGHTESASGIAGIMKVVLALEAGLIPPSIGVESLNPKIDFEAANVKVLTELTPWPPGKLRRASINSFGFGGANGHCIIDHVNVVLPGYLKPGLNNDGTAKEVRGLNLPVHNGHYPENCMDPLFYGVSHNGDPHARGTCLSNVEHHQDAGTRRLVLLPFTAHHRDSLKRNMLLLAEVLMKKKHSLSDVAYTLSARRQMFMERTFRIVDSQNVADGMAIEQPISSSAAAKSCVGFVFTGQGAQWLGMGKQLFEYRVFRDKINFLDRVIATMSPKWEFAWTIKGVLQGDCSQELVHTPDVSQTVCTALQIGIVDLLASWSVRPAAAIGHSSGEIAAAYSAGRLTAAEAITVAFLRGQIVGTNREKGAMLATGMTMGQLDASNYLQELQGSVEVAAINSPRSITLSGDLLDILKVSESLTEAGIFNRVLHTGGNAYHSRHMKKLGSRYQELLDEGSINISKQELPETPRSPGDVVWVSTVTPTKDASKISADSAYWRSNLESPVRFSEGLEQLLQIAPVNTLVEIGPHAALRGPVTQIVSDKELNTSVLPSLERNQDGQACLLRLVGALFGINVQVDLAAVNAVDAVAGGNIVQGCMAVDLPPYQFTYGPINYHESRVSREYRSRKTIRHDLIGSQVPGGAKWRPQWRNILRIKDLPWLGDHRLLPDTVLPGAAYVAMALEAVARVYRECQDSLPIEGYILRNVDIKCALRIPEDDYGVEVMVNLDLTDISTAESPRYVDFTISSVSANSNVWAMHCSGSVKVLVSQMPPSIARQSWDMDARLVSSQHAYEKFEEIGLAYGQAFRGLSDVEADPTQNLAKAALKLEMLGNMGGSRRHETSHYPVHPTALDALFQLGLLSCYGGQIDRMNHAYVPVHISQAYIRHSNQESLGNAVAHGELCGLRGARAKLQILGHSDDVIVDIPQLRYIRYGDTSSGDTARVRSFSSPFMRLTWHPDIRTLSAKRAKELFPPPEENLGNEQVFKTIHCITALIVVDIHDKYSYRLDLPGSSDQICHYLAWVRRRVLTDKTEAMRQAKDLTTKARHELLESLCRTVGSVIEVKIALKLQSSMEDIVFERRTGVDVLVQEGLLKSLYETGLGIRGSYPQLRRLLNGLGHSNPNQRILEIGAGTGGATRQAMAALYDEGTHIKRYDHYTFTDVSSAFLVSARDSFSGYANMTFSVLDIERDPWQGEHQDGYDVILASQCLHATSSIAKTLRNCSRLLKPGGRMILVENTGDTFVQGFILGTLTGYWTGACEGRVDSPFMDLPSWEKALRDAGFSGIDLVLDDYPPPYTTSTVILTTLVVVATDPGLESGFPSGTMLTTSKLEAEAERDTPDMAHLLYSNGKAPPVISFLVRELEAGGVSCEVEDMDAAFAIAPGSRIVAFLDGENLLLQPDSRRLALFQHLAASSSTMVWVTSCGIVSGKNADGALASGLLRVIGTENPTAKLLFMDLDHSIDDTGELADIASWIAEKEAALQTDVFEPGMSEDREFSWHAGCGWISRLLPDSRLVEQQDLVSMPMNRAKSLPIDSQGPVRAEFGTPGVLSTLYFRPYTELCLALPSDFIEVKVSAIGLNWKDLGIAAGNIDANHLSAEYSGVVTKIGSLVTNLSVGDAVYGMGHGHFGNVTRVPACFAAKLRPSDDMVAVATMPLVYMTAVYAFDYTTVLKAGERVLIQSATGGLGLAAIQLARAKGADVYATAGTQSKVRFLIDQVGLPESHVFSSRDVTGLQRATHVATEGLGFDVVLSAARDVDMLHETFKVLAPLGRLIDVGRLQVMAGSRLGLELFQRSITFASFDLGLILEASPHTGARLMQAVDTYYRAGDIGPIQPCMVSSVDRLNDVLVGFSKGTHIGKHVISYQDSQTMVRMVAKSAHRAHFDPQAGYVVAGGFGALGRSIIGWMADRGACHVTALSRSGPKEPEVDSLVKRLARRGVQVESVICDISDEDQVQQAIGAIAKVRQVRGVVHAAMLLQDISFAKITAHQWNQGIAAKVAGTKALHNATLGMPLDFFVMIASLDSILALATQSAYVAANQFQEAFARQRRRQGLPASTASFGLLSDVGYLSRTATAVNTMIRNKALSITEQQFLRLVEPAFVNSSGRPHPYDPLSDAGIFTCLDPATMAARKMQDTEDTTVPHWHRDGRVSLVLKATSDACRSNAQATQNMDTSTGSYPSAILKLREDFNESILASHETGSCNALLSLVADAVTTTMAGMLSIDAAGIDIKKTVASYGVDSLVAAELRNWFNLAFQANISLLDLLDTQVSIENLAQLVVDEKVKQKKRRGSLS